ncbi:hypothetical protein [Lactobacillus sp. 3B(2020)]|uniref:hypothetical protein n=1 Tax=Lactobacillus sp. 3B(2020) TaxID=2695882 RepID=UPI0015DDF47F|nr:hypothetical protein [Lactobacillus sp. 3B(2020)]QLL69613.1 hypothetical protein GTO83_03190 [Lactobacillus sp. 3B(2020)]
MMKELKGSEKQIKFAGDIRNYVIFQMEKLDNEYLAKLVINFVSRTSKAKLIIDTFVDSFYEKDVQETVKMAFHWVDEGEKFTQAEIKSKIKTTHVLEKYSDVEFDDKGAAKKAQATKKIERTLNYMENDVEEGYISNRSKDIYHEALADLHRYGVDTSAYEAKYDELVAKLEAQEESKEEEEQEQVEVQEQEETESEEEAEEQPIEKEVAEKEVVTLDTDEFIPQIGQVVTDEGKQYKVIQVYRKFVPVEVLEDFDELDLAMDNPNGYTYYEYKAKLIK